VPVGNVVRDDIGIHPDFVPISTGGTIMGRRKSGAFPRATIHKASGRARVRLCGREYWLGIAGTKEADDKFRLLVASFVASGGTSVDESVLASGPVVVTVKPGAAVAVELAPAPPAALSIGGLLVRYLQAVKGNRTPEELRGCSRWWRARQVANALDSRTAVPVELLGPRMLREVRDELVALPMEAKRGGESVHRTRGVINRTIREIVSMLKWAVGEELVPVERYQALRCLTGLRAGDNTPARESVPRKGVPDSEVAAICPFLPPVLADVIWFSRHSRCRPGEAFRLCMADLRPAGVPGAEDALEWNLAEHKTAHHGKVRRIGVGPQAREILSRWSGGKAPTELVFTRTDVERVRTETTIRTRKDQKAGERLTSEYLRRSVLRACEAAGVPRWTPYQVRHAGLQETRDIAGPETAQAVGGQSHLKTVEIYAQASFEKAAQFAAKYG
jgi:integrase